MSLCDNIFDCNRKSLDELMKMNNAVNELQQKVDAMQTTPNHGFIYYIMSEIAVIYILYLLRNYLQPRMLMRMFLGIGSLYQRMLSYRTRMFGIRSSSTCTNESVELDETSTVNTELTSSYGINVGRVLQGTPDLRVYEEIEMIIPHVIRDEISLESLDQIETSFSTDEYHVRLVDVDKPDSETLLDEVALGFSPEIINDAFHNTGMIEINLSSDERTVESSEAATNRSRIQIV